MDSKYLKYAHWKTLAEMFGRMKGALYRVVRQMDELKLTRLMMRFTPYGSVHTRGGQRPDVQEGRDGFDVSRRAGEEPL